MHESIRHPSIEEHMKVGKHAEIFRLAVSKESGINGKPIKKINLPQKSLIVAIEREDKFIIPTEDAELYAGDNLTILAHKEQVDKVVKIFSES